MAGLSPAKALLLAVQLASKADISALRTLLSQNRIHTEVLLRVLLSHLPETLDSAEYVPFLEDIISGTIKEESPLDSSALAELSEDEAKHKARKLHLLPLAWPHHPSDIPADPLVLFLIHRSLRIDENTGLITQLPGLIAPFIQHSTYLRSWLITSVVPLLRLNYEYHPEEITTLTIPKFELLDDRAGLKLLLSRTGQNDNADGQDPTVGRDLRGLVGPWMYGDTRWKRRNLFALHKQTVVPVGECPIHHYKYFGWEEVFKWIIEQAATSWKTAVEAVEQWDGPGDVDTGGYADGSTWLDENDEQHLEIRYARSILAAAYIVTEDSLEALNGVQRILARLITLMDKDRIPSLQQAAALLQPVSIFGNELLSPKNATFLRNHLLDDQNILTTPKDDSIEILHANLISAYLCTKAGARLNIRRVGELVFLQDEHGQRLEFSKLMLQINNGPKGDDKYWIKMRNEILWLRNWGAEELEEGADPVLGRGIFGKLPKDFIEVELLKALLNNTRYTLARSIYETSPDKPLSKNVLQETIIAAAMNAYDNATNPNKTRGGVKKASEMHVYRGQIAKSNANFTARINSFPDNLQGSLEAAQTEHLISLTHEVGKYKLVFKQGEHFKPVSLRVHSDPISIIGKILDQNPNSYAQISDFIDIGKAMVKSGLTSRKPTGESTIGELQKQQVNEQLSIAEKRVVSMCIDAALAEDDFETAYSYVVTRLKDVSGPAHARSPGPERKNHGLFPEPPPKIIDDWSWRAALQAGKYRRSSHTLKPTHLGNASANPEIRHLEQRMECLSQALRLAPKATLQEILNVYRRCEEELESQYMQEAEQEDAWDTQGDNTMPGGFAPIPMKKNKTSKTSRSAEEAPMSLFDLSRASMARAQNGFSSLAMARNIQQKPRPASRASEESSRVGTPDSGAPGHVRKRDQLRNAAVGGFASGVGWILGAPPVKGTNNEEQMK